MLIQYFNIHGLLSIKLERLRAHPLDNYLMRPLGQYAVDEIFAPLDLRIRINPANFQVLRKPGTIIVDNFWHVSEDKITSRETHKGGKWLAEIEHLDKPLKTCSVNVQTNHLGRVVYPDIVFSYIRLLLNLRGVADVHGASVSKDGQGYLFVGRSGVGKSVTAVNFMRRGYDLLGDDFSFLNDGKVLSDLRSINIRYTYNPEETLGVKFSVRQKLAVQSKKLMANSLAVV